MTLTLVCLLTLLCIPEFVWWMDHHSSPLAGKVPTHNSIIMLSYVKEMTLKPTQYSIFSLAYILNMANVTFQAIYQIIPQTVTIIYGITQVIRGKYGNIAIVADSCTILTSGWPTAFQFWFLFISLDLSPDQQVLEIDSSKHIISTQWALSSTRPEWTCRGFPVSLTNDLSKTIFQEKLFC